MIASAVAQERDLFRAPRAITVDPVRLRAADVAVAHARRFVNLPPFEIVWVRAPSGYLGETDFYGHNGHIEIRLRADLPARECEAATFREGLLIVLHELGHVADARIIERMTHQEAESRAWAFAGEVLWTIDILEEMKR